MTMMHPPDRTTAEPVPDAQTCSDSDPGSGPDVDTGSRIANGGGGGGEPTSPTSPLAPYPPLPPSEARSRAPEFYGFVAWTATYLLFFLYLLWAFLPDARIEALGVSWYPNREWALLVPAYGMVLVLLTYFTYFALALAGTPSFADMRTITDTKVHLPGPLLPPPARLLPPVRTEHDDENASSSDPAAPSSSASAFSPRNPKPKPKPSPAAAVPEPKPAREPNPYLAHARPGAIPELYDIPLGLVNRVVYGPHSSARRGQTRSSTAAVTDPCP